MDKKESKKSPLLYVLLMVWGELFILLDAGFIGYLYAIPNKNLTIEVIVAFWVFLLLGVLFRYWAEKFR